MKIKIEFTVDVISENIQAYLDEVNIDETVREYVTSYYTSLESMLDETLRNQVGLDAIVNNNNEMIVEYSEAITEFDAGVHTIIHQPVDGVRKVSIENEPTNYTCRKIAGKWTVLFNSSPVATVTRAGDLIKAIAKHSGTEYPKD